MKNLPDAIAILIGLYDGVRFASTVLLSGRVAGVIPPPSERPPHIAVRLVKTELHRYTEWRGASFYVAPPERLRETEPTFTQRPNRWSGA